MTVNTEIFHCHNPSCTTMALGWLSL